MYQNVLRDVIIYQFCMICTDSSLVSHISLFQDTYCPIWYSSCYDEGHLVMFLVLFTVSIWILYPTTLISRACISLQLSIIYNVIKIICPIFPSNMSAYFMSLILMMLYTLHIIIKCYYSHTRDKHGRQYVIAVTLFSIYGIGKRPSPFLLHPSSHPHDH